MYTKSNYAVAFEKFKSRNLGMWRRYETSAAAELLLAHLVQEQQPPSQITVELGIKRFLVRVDGGTSETDTQQALQKITAQIDEPDLTRSEIEFFQGLNPRDVEQRYWEANGYNQFAVRFNKAIRERPYGLIFTAPGRPATAVDDNEAVGLSAAEYHAMPANLIIQKLKSVPGFRASVDKLIARGEI